MSAHTKRSLQNYIREHMPEELQVHGDHETQGRPCRYALFTSWVQPQSNLPSHLVDQIKEHLDGRKIFINTLQVLDYDGAMIELTYYLQ